MVSLFECVFNSKLTRCGEFKQRCASAIVTDSDKEEEEMLIACRCSVFVSPSHWGLPNIQPEARVKSGVSAGLLGYFIWSYME